MKRSHLIESKAVFCMRRIQELGSTHVKYGRARFGVINKAYLTAEQKGF